MKTFPIWEVDDIKTFTFNILDWGIMKFEKLLYTPTLFWVEKFGLYDTTKPTRQEIISYLDTVTKGFNPRYVKAVYDDMGNAYQDYLSKIKNALTYVIRKYTSPIDAVEFSSYGKSLFEKISWEERPGRTKFTFPLAHILSSDEDCRKSLDLDISLYEYARDVLREAAGIKANLSATSKFALSPELDTPRAREYFKKAQEAGFIAKTDTGFKWTMTAGRGALAQLAYFCGRVYCPGSVGKLPETALNRLFGVSRIGSALTQVNNASPQKWRQRIDRIFED